MKIKCSHNAEDVRTLVESGMETCSAAEFGFALSVDCLLRSIGEWLTACPGELIIATEDDDRPIGFVQVTAQPNIGCDDTMAVVKHWYAEPNRALVGPKLFCLARDWGRDHGCTHFLITASQMASHHYGEVKRFCRNVGMQEFETTYICALSEE